MAVLELGPFGVFGHRFLVPVLLQHGCWLIPAWNVLGWDLDPVWLLYGEQTVQVQAGTSSEPVLEALWWYGGRPEAHGATDVDANANGTSRAQGGSPIGGDQLATPTVGGLVAEQLKSSMKLKGWRRWWAKEEVIKVW